MQNIVNFILELDKLKSVTRKTSLLNGERYENSAEHSWQIAMLASSLAPYAAGDATKPVDINRVIAMLLVHDIGEIDTGDTIVYQEEGLADRKLAEQQAVARIFGLLGSAEHKPYAEELMTLWLEFERAETAEARFAHAADRAMPVLLNLANKGQSWVENGIRYEQVIRKIKTPIQAGCPALWDYLEVELDAARGKGYFDDEISD